MRAGHFLSGKSEHCKYQVYDIIIININTLLYINRGSYLDLTKNAV